MTPLHAIDGGRHRRLRDYGLSMDTHIPPLLAGGGRAADVVLQLAREIRTHDPRLPRSEWRLALTHLRRAWIGHCCGNLAVCELEYERARAVRLRNSPLVDIAGRSLLANQRRGFALSAPNRKRNRKINVLADQGVGTDELHVLHDLTKRQIRNIKARRVNTGRK